MKKGLLALAGMLALAVLVTPGIIGQLAEKSVDENLLWAVSRNGDVAVSATDFEGSWFASSGRHRFELQDGQLYKDLMPDGAPFVPGSLPALIVDTRLDHGLLPVNSLFREGGSLLPALGNAISTLSLEMPDGEVLPLPATIYTIIGVTGSLRSHIVVEPGKIELAEIRFDWGSSDFVFRSNARTGGLGLVGTLSSFLVESEQETMVLGGLAVDSDLEMTDYGFMVGPVELSLTSIESIGSGQAFAAGPLRFEVDSSLEGDRLDAEADFSLDGVSASPAGAGAVQLVARIENVAADELADLMYRLDAGETEDLASNLMHLLARGMEIHFEQLDASTPFGDLRSRLDASVQSADTDDYDWASVILATEASADISVSEGMVDIAGASSPQLGMLIGMGFLRKEGDVYVLHAALQKGLLTVNGAPLALPLSSF